MNEPTAVGVSVDAMSEMATRASAAAGPRRHVTWLAARDAMAGFDPLPSAPDRLGSTEDGTPAGAAVCICLCERTVTEGLDTAFLLTRRSARLAKHPGQWALPGGRIDADETAEMAAVRELDEEVGLRVDASDVLGRLDDYVTRSGFRITPVVVWAGRLDHEPQGNPDEVESVHVVGLGQIDVEPRLLEIEESARPVIQIPLFGSFIHAPTGAILFQLREVLLYRRSTRVVHFEQPVFAWR